MTIEDEDPLFPLDDRAGPATPMSADRAAAMIEAAITAHAAPPVRRLPSRSRRWLAVALAAALVLVLGSALAATLKHVLSSHASQPPPLEQPEPRPFVSVAPPLLTALSVPTVEELVVPAPAVSEAPKEPPPADLLRLANEQRGEHRWADAERSYQRVIARSPHGPEAYAASVAAASIRLEHLGDAAGALRLYQSALAERPSGALAEEARWGVAESQHALGNKDAEVAALRAFIAAHPDSVMRASAEKRLRGLGSDFGATP